MRSNRRHRLRSDVAGHDERGAALLMVLVTVVVIGLAAGIAGQSWRSVVQRAKEDDLLWRGKQYRAAIESYYRTRQGAPGMYPRQLEDLVRDNRFPQPVRHIRRLYNDPMTGRDWMIIKAPDGGIAGVRSNSDLRPFRQKGFPNELAALAGSESYRDWEFVYVPAKTGAQGANPVSGAPGLGTFPGSQTSQDNAGTPGNQALPQSE